MRKIEFDDGAIDVEAMVVGGSRRDKDSGWPSLLADPTPSQLYGGNP